MDMISVRRKPIIVGVMGSHTDDREAMEDARRIGEAIARRGYVLLTGGGPGVMKAACEGAHRAGGLVIGILPCERDRPLAGYPNDFVDVPIYTGMYEARNVINAKTPHCIVALRGGPGTLSEIALALRAGTPVVGLHAPSFHVSDMEQFYATSSVEAALRKLDHILEGIAE